MSTTESGAWEMSSALASVWAKTGGQTHWLPLFQHVQDSMDVAALLYENWLSPQTKQRWAAFDRTPGLVRKVAIFLSAVHDVGKASPAFVCQSEPLADQARMQGLACHTKDDLKEQRKHLPHSVVSEHALFGWVQNLGVDYEDAFALASVVGAHHGRPATAGEIKQANWYPDGLGDQSWAQLRRELLEHCDEVIGLSSELAEVDRLDWPLSLLVELSGFVIVADWMASNTGYFPLYEKGALTTPVSGPHRYIQAWDEAAMPGPWAPAPSELDAAAFYMNRFGWGPGSAPRPMQTAAFELASSHDVGMLVIEATTGGGKTEAALAAAEVIAAARGSQGIVVALPTQATTNAMFGRVETWLSRQPALPVEEPAWALTLGHNKARLNPAYAELLEATNAVDTVQPASPAAEIYDEQVEGTGELSNFAVHQWFTGAKRRLLANFAVVTIDQVLMSALQRKHLMLAHLALSSKVVIIDEAHASDDYMNVYLDTALAWLGEYGVPVIILSATLTEERRREMIRAYAPSRAQELVSLDGSEQFPRLTLVPRAENEPMHVVGVADTTGSRTVEWLWHPTGLDHVVTSVLQAVADGGCALVIRNTVKDAQATAQLLRERGVDVLLNHAGFIAVDRALNDRRLVSLFGKTGEGTRPEQAVVVATQVAEQSLDIDFDVLFTDLAPADLLIQRLGRLHRHPSRVRPQHLQAPRCFLLADLAEGQPPQATRGTRFVYGDHYLMRTAAALEELGPHIRIPEDTAPLVQRALGDEELPPAVWADAFGEAAEAHRAARSKQQLKAGTWRLKTPHENRDAYHLGEWIELVSDRDEQLMAAAVRDSTPTVEVILVPICADGITALRPPWLTEASEHVETLDTSSVPSMELGREIASWSVKLPASVAQRDPSSVISAIESIPETQSWAWRRHPLLRGELLLPMRKIDDLGHDLLAELHVGDRNLELRYSPANGMEATWQTDSTW